MVRVKSDEDIARLAEGGAILSRILDELEQKAVVGAVPVELDKLAQERLWESDCQPAFLNYAPKGHDPFPAALCVSVNDAVVHGLPGRESLREGDVVGLDLGLIYQNRYYLDSARTIGVGKISKDSRRLIEVTKESLRLGIAAAQPGNHIGDIGEAIQSYVEGRGFSIVRQLVGHGVGFAVHEEPAVPNFGQAGEGLLIEPGLVIAIEPMVTSGDPYVETGSDGWSVIVSSGNITAHQEHTVAITADGPFVLTQ